MLEAIAKAIVVMIFVLFLMMLLSSCAILRPISDAIFGSGTDLGSVDLPIPKAQMWETIKGLTPNWLAIPVIALGAVAMFNGAAKLGMSCIIFGSVNLFMALATSRFGFWMAVCGLVGSMAAVAASILAKNIALREIVMGTQKVKELQVSTSIANGILAKQQKHKSTKKIVQQIKTKAKLQGKI